ncbi:UNVERIFIED_CONTAM: hypothetical protein FKN15_055418 [Acipenser sinensis]
MCILSLHTCQSALLCGFCVADSWMWKLFYVAGCCFVAIQNLEEWEEAFFDKSKGQVILKSFNLYTKILTMWRKGHEQATERFDIRTKVMENDADAIAELLKRFLGLDKAQQWEKVSDSDSSESDQIELDEN